MGRRVDPRTRYLLILLGLSFFFALFLWYRISATIRWDSIIFSWLISINLITFSCYGMDKWFAKRGSRRIPERALHGITLAGGTPGAYLGMRTFRHKTIKAKFRFTFFLIIMIQTVFFVWMLLRWLF
jgi:uncharacterized membrane protein YsdA (DUF1294 family)